MLVLLRHLFAILALPFVVALVVPWAIARRSGTTFAWPSGAADAALLALGIGALGIGLVLFTSSVYQFASRGRGTLAPWDPVRRLVPRLKPWRPEAIS